ncbi:MAG: hypothetical protein JEY91_01695 [Spirochaetaceae bacterium]|nr:hypothetical protein [Spirochaetaceae bacterium]
MEKKKSIVKTESFTELVNLFSNPILSYANYAISRKNKNDILNTLFLGKSYSAASRLEELLDRYNAKYNQKWKSFRENIAAIKLFTNVTYITLHLKSTSPHYRLVSGVDLFLEDTDKVLDIFYNALHSSFHEVLKNAKKNSLHSSSEIDKAYSFSVDLPEGVLESDMDKRHIDSPETVIVNLATSYLNLACESLLLENVRTTSKKNYEELVPEVISENKLRILENKFHNLQSLYDTYVSNSDIEFMDRNLRLIRGHASIVFHLLEASTSLIHYFERHMMDQTGLIYSFYKSPITKKHILRLLVEYFLNYASQFVIGGKELSREVIKKYAEEGSVEVRVPGYRGFHVRPSTLVSKIVQHYGSDVSLLIDGEEYNASLPMELFRVNEKINAEKRRNLANNICSLHSINDPKCIENFEKGLKEVFHELLEENKIINYSTEFSLPEINRIQEETLGEFANRAIAYLLAQGKIDLKTDLTVSFRGDKRVLADLEILANCGYGEDSYGNNIVLPKELSYIRR